MPHKSSASDTRSSQGLPAVRPLARASRCATAIIISPIRVGEISGHFDPISCIGGRIPTKRESLLRAGRSVEEPRPEDQAYAAKAVKYCRELFVRQPPFDYDLGLDDKAFYCVEMTEKAYRSSGMPLSEPLRLGDMENIARYPICVIAFRSS